VEIDQQGFNGKEEVESHEIKRRTTDDRRDFPPLVIK
jgi:hypothetical protein